MKLMKCPRCELNYIYENEKICSVCKRDVRGEVEQDDIIELCSECGEHPAMPGQELCVYCFKEQQRRNSSVSDDSSVVTAEEPNLNIDPSAMDEINIDLPGDVDDVFDGEAPDFSEDDDMDDEDEEDEE